MGVGRRWELTLMRALLAENKHCVHVIPPGFIQSAGRITQPDTEGIGLGPGAHDAHCVGFAALSCAAAAADKVS